MPDLRTITALGGRDAPEGLCVALREMPPRGMIDLRGLSNDRKFLNAVKTVLELDLPRAPRTSVSWGEHKALWLAPDQWLILCPAPKITDLMARLRQALTKAHHLAVDVGDMRAVLRLEGENARTVLLKGCSLDLLSDAYPPGTVRRLRFAEIAALLHVVEDDVFELYVFRSYTDYAWDFLCKAGRVVPSMRLFGVQTVADV